jgi:hypothetical protein
MQYPQTISRQTQPQRPVRTHPAVHDITRTRRTPGERAAAAVVVSNAALLAVATWRLVTPFTPPLSGFDLGTEPSTCVWSAAAVVALGTRGGGRGLFLKVEAGITTWYKFDAQPMKPVGKKGAGMGTSVTVLLLLAAAIAAMSGRPSVLRTAFTLNTLPCAAGRGSDMKMERRQGQG